MVGAYLLDLVAALDRARVALAAAITLSDNVSKINGSDSRRPTGSVGLVGSLVQVVLPVSLDVEDDDGTELVPVPQVADVVPVPQVADVVSVLLVPQVDVLSPPLDVVDVLEVGSEVSAGGDQVSSVHKVGEAYVLDVQVGVPVGPQVGTELDDVWLVCSSDSATGLALIR